MSSFALLHSSILDSSVWQLSKEARLVWITMLAMKDQGGVVHAAEIGLAARARVTLDECREALRTFREPDPLSSTPTDDGRRIQDVPGGWKIINADYYRFGTDEKREFWRQQKAIQRAKAAAKEAEKEAKRLAKLAAKASAALGGVSSGDAAVNTAAALDKAGKPEEAARTLELAAALNDAAVAPAAPKNGSETPFDK